MQGLILFDDDNWQGLLPLTFTRPICELRVGILTIREKWEKYLQSKASHITQDYLSGKYPIQIKEDNIVINSTILPTPQLVEMVKDLKMDEAIIAGDELLAARIGAEQFHYLSEDQAINELKGKDISEYPELFTQIVRPYDLFQHNGEEIIKDFQLLTEGRASAALNDTNRTVGDHAIFVEEGAEVNFAIINASEGPVYIGKNSVVLEGSMIKGPFALCDHGVVKMGAKIYPKTTVGRYSKAGGEINNCILSDYSNKGHEGDLGNSVIGQWCNLGADTNNSNLKNNYAEVKMWHYGSESFENSGLQFCGLIMGDHSKCGINSMFNTGTVIGVSANIFGSGFLRPYVPSFAWGGTKGFSTYKLKKALQTVEKVVARRGYTPTEEDYNILTHVYYYTALWRVWDRKKS